MGELVDLSLKRVKDVRLRKLIFGAEQPEEKTITGKIIFCMSNIMLMSFFGFFMLWKHREDFETTGSDSANTKRINNTFADIYSGSGLNTEVIAFLLTEIQLDAVKNPFSPYRNYVKENVTCSRFQQIAEIVRVWRISYKHAEQNLEKLTTLYVELIKSLPILRKLQVNDLAGKMEFTLLTEDDDEITEDMSCFIRLIEYDFESDYYFLHRAIKADNVIKLEYMDFSGGNTCSGDENGDFTIGVGEFRRLIGYSATYKQGNTVQNLNILNFKYIRKLAMAVADVLQKGTKRIIKGTYENNRKYKEIFENGNIDELNWDNIVVLLMLEEGPSDVIEEVLKNDANAFYDILRNVSVRFDLDINKLNEKFEQLQHTEEIYEEKQHKGFKEVKTLNLWRRSAEISLMAQFIVSVVADTDIDNVTTNAFYAESLSMKKKKIEAIRKDANASEVEVVQLLNKTFERVFRMLIVFYKGILAYAQAREKMLKDVIDLRRRQSSEFLEKLQENCERAFFNAVENCMKQQTNTGKSLNNSSLGVLIGIFEELCADMGKKKGDFFVERGDNGKLLHSIIGRSEICDVSQLRRIINISQGELGDDLNSPKDLLEFFNKYLKHDDVSVDIRDNVVKLYYDRSLELLKFLAFNKDYLREGKMCHQLIYDPIFPYVVRYSEKSENRDKCSVCQYVINTDGEFDKTMGIKLLTEFDYKINELYYCIPNAECSTKNWWVAPFLISCRDFDRIFLKLSEVDGEGDKE